MPTLRKKAPASLTTFTVALAYTAECCSRSHVYLRTIKARTWKDAARKSRTGSNKSLGGVEFGDCAISEPGGSIFFMDPDGEEIEYN
jgi:hypothetical protein